MESGAEHLEVPKKYAAMKLIRGLRKQHRGQKLAAERCQELKERTRGNCGSRKELAATGRKMPCHAGVTQHKETSSGRVKTWDRVARGALKRWTLGKRHQPKPECKSGVKDRSTRQQLPLKNEKTAG
jgi:hypothetical protein